MIVKNDSSFIEDYNYEEIKRKILYINIQEGF